MVKKLVATLKFYYDLEEWDDHHSAISTDSEIEKDCPNIVKGIVEYFSESVSDEIDHFIECSL